jgi:hypothetical protein
MRTSSLLSLLCAAWTAQSSSLGHVLYFDPESKPHESSDSIQPSTARLILAERLGLSSFYSLANSDSDAIRQIDSYGRSQKHLFEHAQVSDSQSRVLLLVEGVENPKGKAPILTVAKPHLTDAIDIFPLDTTSKFSSYKIQAAPHPHHNERLISEFAEHASQDNNGASDSPVIRAIEKLSGTHGNTMENYGRRTILHHKGLAVSVAVSVHDCY